MRYTSASCLALVAGLMAVTCAAAAEISITSVPDGANVYIDDTFVGVSPVTVDTLQAGAHVVRVEKRGCIPYQQAVLVEDAPLQMHADLATKALGGMTLDSVPPGAAVLIDGEQQGETPLMIVGLAPGIYAVQMTFEGYVTWSADIAVAEGEPQPVTAELEARIEGYLVAEIEAHPEAITNYVDLAHHYILAHDFDAAFEVFAKGFDAVAEYRDAAAPDEIRRLTDEIGRVYVAQYDYADGATVAAMQPRVVATLEEAIQRHPTCGEPYVALADIYRDSGVPASAREVLERGAPLVEGLADSIRVKGRLAAQLSPIGAAHVQAEDWNNAITAYEDVIAKLPGLYQARGAMEQIAMVRAAHLGDFAGAIEELRTILSEYPDPHLDPQYLQQIATYQRSLDDFAGAAATHEEVAGKYPGSESVQTALAQAASIQGNQLQNPDKALELYLRCAEVDPATQEGTLATKYAIDILRSKGETERADAVAKELMETYPASLGGYYVETREDRKTRNAAAVVIYQEAAQLAQNQDLVGAIAKYLECADQYPDTYHGMTALTQAISIQYSRQNDYAAAIASRRLYIGRYPDDAQAPVYLWYIGYSYQNQIGDIDAAIATYTEFMERYPDDPKAPQVLYYLGLIYYSIQSEFAKGLEAFERIVNDYADTSSYPQGLYYAGECLMSMLEVDRARALWTEMLDRFPGDSLAFTAAEAMMRVRRRAGRGQFAEDGQDEEK